MFSLKGLVKRKIKFKSLKPPIKNIKPLLDRTEKWFNSLILNEGFESKYNCHGSTIITLEEYNKKDQMISVKYPMIYDVIIQKEVEAIGRFRFAYNITLGVLWPEYDYFEYFGENNGYFNKNFLMSNLSEVPEPIFSYNFIFFEITSHIPRDSKKIIYRLDPDTIIRPRVSIHEDTQWKEIFNNSKKIRSLNILKDEYSKFFKDMNNHLSQYNLNLQNFRDKKNPICLIQ